MRKNDILNDFPELRNAHEEAVAFEKQAALDRHKYISVATKIIEQLNSASQRGEISIDRAWTYRIPRFLDMFKKIHVEQKLTPFSLMMKREKPLLSCKVKKSE